MKTMPIKTIFLSAALALPMSVYAQTMPWEGPICNIVNSFSGPVAVAFVVLAVVLCGAMLAFGELNGIFKTLLGVAIGGAMAVGAVQWTVMFTGPTNMGCVGKRAALDSIMSVAELITPLTSQLTAMI